MFSDVPITQGNLAVNGVRAVDLLRQRLDAEELETAALRELLSRCREGERISADADGQAAL